LSLGFRVCSSEKFDIGVPFSPTFSFVPLLPVPLLPVPFSPGSSLPKIIVSTGGSIEHLPP